MARGAGDWKARSPLADDPAAREVPAEAAANQQDASLTEAVEDGRRGSVPRTTPNAEKLSEQGPETVPVAYDT
jgi:hypothetical protein